MRTIQITGAKVRYQKLVENEDDITFGVYLPADFPLGDLEQIASMLEQANVFVPGYIPPDVGMYHLMDYFYGSMVDKVDLIMLPDRNIVSRLAKATIGRAADDQQRLAAAVEGAILATP